MIMALRNMAVREGNMAPQHKKVAELISKTGHMVNLRDEDKVLRKKLGLSEVPPTVLMTPEALEQVKKICEITGFYKLIEGGSK